MTRSRVRPGACLLVLCALGSRALAAQQITARMELPDAPVAQQENEKTAGSVRGTVVDRDGAMVVGAKVTLIQTPSGGVAVRQQVISDTDGAFRFDGVLPGAFVLNVTFVGFATEVTSGTMPAGQTEQISAITLHPGMESDVEVTLSRTEIAEEQIHEQEQQKVLGAIPNFYVSYVPNALPLTPRQKFELAWKTTIDPFNIGVTAVIAGVQQANNSFSGYGQGAAGYGKRFGAGYGDLVVGTMVGGAVLPILLKQDPRYFYNGKGTVRHRVLYALAMSVVAKGDNGRWQPNYSGILGSLASGGVSNAYYPEGNRSGAATTFENTAIGIGSDAIANIFQEFVVLHFTPAAKRNRKAAATAVVPVVPGNAVPQP